MVTTSGNSCFPTAKQPDPPDVEDVEEFVIKPTVQRAPRKPYNALETKVSKIARRRQFKRRWAALAANFSLESRCTLLLDSLGAEETSWLRERLFADRFKGRRGENEFSTQYLQGMAWAQIGCEWVEKMKQYSSRVRYIPFVLLCQSLRAQGYTDRKTVKRELGFKPSDVPWHASATDTGRVEQVKYDNGRKGLRRVDPAMFKPVLEESTT